MPFIRVAVDVPLATLFDYASDDATKEDVGYRVRVPFGRKRVVGVIMEVVDSTNVDGARIRAAEAILRDAAPLPNDLLLLFRFCSDYYHHPIGEIVHGTLPGRFRDARAPRAADKQIQPTAAGRAALLAGFKRSPVLTHVMNVLCARGVLSSSDLTVPERRALNRALRHGWAVEQTAPLAARACEDAAAVASWRASSLNPEQKAVLAKLSSAPSGFRCWLLHGVTGSGKTEIYLHAMAAVLAAGKQVLFLVPEIGLTPQLEARIRSGFPQLSLVVMHSNLAAGLRAENWECARVGHARIVLGARSAIFAPMPQLGLIVVDEENDASFKQADGFRYCARDLAVWRAHQRAIPIILGSATPSLESYQAALSGRYAIASLTERANGTPLPEIRMLGVGHDPSATAIAAPLLEALRTKHSRGEQSLVFINRRGYAPVLVCSACAWSVSCPRCSARLVLHKPRPRMICHHCGHEEGVPTVCAHCGNADLHLLGYGTQRIESMLRNALPDLRILRVDRDTTRGRHTWENLRASIERREVDVLIGTQLLAKGHDFPNLSLVCVLNADQSLYSTDFRAAEQLFAQLTQVAGRAGRARIRGEVLIQTQFPSHPIYRAVQKHDFDAFARLLLEERRQAGLPPFTHQAVLRAESASMLESLKFLRQAVDAAQCICDGVSVYDPAPATMQRLKGRERAQVLVQSQSRARLHAFLNDWMSKVSQVRPAAARWSLDVDPLSI